MSRGEPVHSVFHLPFGLRHTHSNDSHLVDLVHTRQRRYQLFREVYCKWDLSKVGSPFYPPVGAMLALVCGRGNVKLLLWKRHLLQIRKEVALKDR